MTSTTPLIKIDKNGPTPLLWTDDKGVSHFTFGLEVDMNALYKDAGGTLCTTKESTLMERRLIERLKAALNGVLIDLCEGQIKNQTANDFSQTLTFNVEVPAKHAMAMATLLDAEESRTVGFKVPAENLSLNDGAIVLQKEFLQQMNRQANLLATHIKFAISPEATEAASRN